VQAGQILAAAVFLPLSYALSKEAFLSWGWRIPFLLSVLVLIVGIIIRREVEETPAFREEQAKHTIPTAPVREALTNHSADLLRVMAMALMNVIPVVATIFGAAYAVQPGYGVQMDKSVYTDSRGRQHCRCDRDPVRRRALRPYRSPAANHPWRIRGRTACVCLSSRNQH
jgi:MFS family permease